MKPENRLQDLEKYIDGECSADAERSLRAELAHDPDLAEAAFRLQNLSTVVREASGATQAPASLRDAVAERYSESGEADNVTALRSRLGRRSFLIGAGGAIAAGLTGLAVIPNLNLLTRSSPDAVGTFFHDFETYLAKDRAIDIRETNMVHLADWYRSRLPFALPPVSSAGGGMKLVGGRLCWLLERRLASLSYESPDAALVLYIMQGDGIEVSSGHETVQSGKKFSWHRSANFTGLTWKSNGLLHAMVGQLELRQLMSVARTLVG